MFPYLNENIDICIRNDDPHPSKLPTSPRSPRPKSLFPSPHVVPESPDPSPI